ncbi:putative colanic acid biosynthesis acetyltransferase, partial [Flavobacterium sp.]|uniref:putative colanic acid biosynthesis acetyltransferase n=1 Tax=Flavobacterium sp. TaxID=239 RepID=UPI001B72E889
KNKLGRFIWFFAYWILFRPFITVFFRRWRNIVLIFFGAKIKGDVTIHPTARIWAPWNLEIDTACISFNTNLYNVNKISIHKGVVISHNVHICTASHDIHNSNHPLISKPIIINKYVWIATDAFIGMGVTIGEGAVVGARAAVFKDVEPWTVVGGNPAKFIKNRILKNG